MRSLLTMTLLALLVALVQAEPPAGDPIPVVALDRKEPVLFDKEIKPILAAKCLVCHSGNVTKGGLDLGSQEAMLKGGKRGPAVMPGRPAESLLVQLAGKSAKPLMPPKGEVPLNPQELALIKLWIDQGAKPAAEQPRRAVIRPLSPAVRLVRSLVVSSDKTLVAAGRGNQVHLFEAGSGNLIRSLINPNLKSPAAHPAIVEALALSPDNKLLASGSFQEVIVWDVATGAIRSKLEGFADRVVALAFSPDGKLLASGGGTPTVDGEIKLIDIVAGAVRTEIKRGHSDTVLGVCFSPDGGKLASAGADTAIKVFEVPSGKLIKSFEGHSHHVLDVAWKADGKILASAGADRKVRLWDYSMGEELKRINKGGGQLTVMSISLEKPPCRVQFVGTTDQLVTAGDIQPIGLYRIEEVNKASNYYTPYFQPRLIRNLANASDYLYALAVSPDGALVVAAGEDGVVRLYDGQKDQLIKELVPPRSASD